MRLVKTNSLAPSHVSISFLSKVMDRKRTLLWHIVTSSGQNTFLPITIDRKEIETRRRSQFVCLDETHGLICNMTYLGIGWIREYWQHGVNTGSSLLSVQKTDNYAKQKIINGIASVWIVRCMRSRVQTETERRRCEAGAEQLMKIRSRSCTIESKISVPRS